MIEDDSYNALQFHCPQFLSNPLGTRLEAQTRNMPAPVPCWLQNTDTSPSNTSGWHCLQPTISHHTTQA